MLRQSLFLLFFTFLFVSSLNAQTENIDSLKKVLKHADDTTKLNTLFALTTAYSDINLDSARIYLNKIDSLNRQINQPKFKAKTFHNKGSFYFKTSKYEDALNSYNQALTIYQNLSADLMIASCHNNIGIINEKKGNYDEALKHLLKALEIWDKKNAKKDLAKVYLNIGLIHFRNQNYEKANEYYNNSLELRKKLDDPEGTALVYNNLAILYYYMGKYDSVRSYFEKSYDIYKSVGNLRKQAMALSNLGEIYFHLGKYDKALNAYNECVEIEKELQDKSGLLATHVMISEVLRARKQYNQSVTHLNKALEMANELEAKDEIKDIYNELYLTFKSKKDFEKALDWHERFFMMNDSIFNATKNKQINELQTKYETEKKERKIELLNKEKKLQESKLKRHRYFVIFISIIAFIVLVFAIIVFIQKKRITAIHQKLSRQQKQITDSIEYASRIQNAILPRQEQIADFFNHDHFIFFKPKEAVSGDFYYIDQKNNKKIVAVVDCTGHGVPGAFMSMLGYSFLSEIIINSETLRADETLNKLRKNIIKALHQKQEIGYSKDGMDISLCIIDESKQTIEFAGAYHYMLYITANEEIHRYKGDKMPIGIHYKQKDSFSQEEIKYNSGDSIYLFTDGFPDQFGGKEGKKFRLKNFQDLLLTINEEPMMTQKELIEKSFKNWKGSCDQLDDVLVMGIRL